MVIDENNSVYGSHLQRYLDGVEPADRLRQVLAEAQWDSDLPPAFQDQLARVYLFALELVEGLRPEVDLRQEVGALLTSLSIVNITAGTGTRSSGSTAYALDAVPALNRV